MHVLAEITNADGSNIGANTAGSINLPLHTMFREILVEVNGRNGSDTSLLYPYRAYLETLLNYSKDSQDTRLLCEGWTKDSSGTMGITEVAGAIGGLNTRSVYFATNTVVDLVDRIYLHVFHQDRLIPSGVDLHMKLIPAADSFVCKFAAPAAGATKQLQNGHLARGSYYPHEAAYHQGPKGALGAPSSPKCVDALFSRSGKAIPAN